MSQETNLKKTITYYYRRLHILKVQKAFEGPRVEPKVLSEIKRLKEKIEALQEKLAGSND